MLVQIFDVYRQTGFRSVQRITDIFVSANGHPHVGRINDQAQLMSGLDSVKHRLQNDVDVNVFVGRKIVCMPQVRSILKIQVAFRNQLERRFFCQLEFHQVVSAPMEAAVDGFASKRGRNCAQTLVLAIVDEHEAQHAVVARTFDP